ncbi:MAG TPA: DUF192 domain-containing protein [Verrucomicrobiae bacterium]|nr:DUF192 domain-containing protein [Verrucomicrobiae bacterium]
MARSSASTSASRLCIREQCFKVEKAATDEARHRGLMFHKPLAPDEGMLLLFKDAQNYRIWMKNMSFPLDVFWLDQHLKILSFRSDVPPCEISPCPTYAPSEPAYHVLELPAGTAQRLQLAPGDQFSFRKSPS